MRAFLAFWTLSLGYQIGGGGTANFPMFIFPFVTVTYLQIARFALLTTYFPIRRQWQFLQQTTRKQNPRELIQRILKRTLCRSLGTSEQPRDLRNRIFLQNIHGQ